MNILIIVKAVFIISFLLALGAYAVAKVIFDPQEAYGVVVGSFFALWFVARWGW